MPIYEYRCADCGFQDEYLRKVSEPALTKCPSCGKESFHKLLSAAGFQLKGSGWYATDFKGSSKPAEGKGEGKGEAKAKAEGKSEAKSEGKSEAKPESKAEPGKSEKAASAASSDN